MYGSSVNYSFIPERADWTYCSNLDSIIMLINDREVMREFTLNTA